MLRQEGQVFKAQGWLAETMQLSQAKRCIRVLEGSLDFYRMKYQAALCQIGELESQLQHLEEVIPNQGRMEGDGRRQSCSVAGGGEVCHPPGRAVNPAGRMRDQRAETRPPGAAHWGARQDPPGAAGKRGSQPCPAAGPNASFGCFAQRVCVLQTGSQLLRHKRQKSAGQSRDAQAEAAVASGGQRLQAVASGGQVPVPWAGAATAAGQRCQAEPQDPGRFCSPGAGCAEPGQGGGSGMGAAAVAATGAGGPAGPPGTGPPKAEPPTGGAGGAGSEQWPRGVCAGAAADATQQPRTAATGCSGIGPGRRQGAAVCPGAGGGAEDFPREGGWRWSGTGAGRSQPSSSSSCCRCHQRTPGETDGGPGPGQATALGGIILAAAAETAAAVAAGGVEGLRPAGPHDGAAVGEWVSASAAG